LLKSELVKLYMPCILRKTGTFEDSKICCQNMYMSRAIAPNNMRASWAHQNYFALLAHLYASRTVGIRLILRLHKEIPNDVVVFNPT